MTEMENISVWVAKHDDKEVEVEIEINKNKSISSLLQKVKPQMFDNSVLLADLVLISHTGEIFKNRNKVNTIDTEQTVLVKSKSNSHKPESTSANQTRDAQLRVLQQELDDIKECKYRMKELQGGSDILHNEMQRAQTMLKSHSYFGSRIDADLTSKEYILRSITSLKQQIEALKFNFKKIDFDNLDLHHSCQNLLNNHAANNMEFRVTKPVIMANTKTKIYQFQNDTQYERSKDATISFADRNAWGNNVGLVNSAYGGVGNATQEYTVGIKSNDTFKESEEYLIKSGKRNKAIAAARVYQEFACFDIENVKLDKIALDIVRGIGKETNQAEQELKALEFLNNYPGEFNMGPFAIGCWSEYVVVVSTSQKNIEYSIMEHQALSACEEVIDVVEKNCFGAMSTSDESNLNTKLIELQEGNFTIKDKCSSIAADCSIATLKKYATNSSKWLIFPSVAGKKHIFKKIYSIIYDLSKETSEGDTELEDAARVLEQIIENGPKNIIREAKIPYDATMKNIIAFGKTGSGKSTLGNVLIGRYGDENDDAFVVSNSAESCTLSMSSKISLSRKIKYFDTIGTFDTREFDAKTGFLKGNESIIKEVVDIWVGIGTDGLHALLFTLSCGEALGELDRKFMQFASTKLFEGNVKSKVILVMTNSKEIMLESSEKRQEYLEKESCSDSSKFGPFYDLVDNDPSRVVFVDCKMPQNALNEERKIEYKKHNLKMAEIVLSKVHSLGMEGVLPPTKIIIDKCQAATEKLEAEQNSPNPDQQKISKLAQEKLELDNLLLQSVLILVGESCVLGSAKILLDNYEWKPISEVKQFDVILDKHLQPRIAIGVNYSYLGKRNLYSFSNDGPFFTPEHQFYSSMLKDETVVVSINSLHKENPQLRANNIKEMTPDSSILQLNTETNCMVGSKIELNEHSDFAADTKVYFLEVTGDGSYVVDGYVAKHDLPDFNMRPFTNMCFANILEIYLSLDEQKKFPVSYDSYTHIISYHVNKLLTLWSFMVEFNIFSKEMVKSINLVSISDPEEIMSMLIEMFREPDSCWFAMHLNTLCTDFLGEHVEMNKSLADEDKMLRIACFIWAADLYLKRM